MTIKAINPATGEQFASYEEMTDEAVRDAIGNAHGAFLTGGEQAFRAAPA
jgi:succinate-semialdehyde dehydrogenase/glutarate-semialdehyde dehydrogenase